MEGGLVKRLLSRLRGDSRVCRGRRSREHSSSLRVEELESRLACSVYATTTASGAPEVFGLGDDREVWAQVFNGNGTGSSGYFLTAPGQFSCLRVTRDNAGDPMVFALGLDNQIYAERMSANGLASTGWFLTTPGQVTSLAVVRDGYGEPEVFGIGMDGQIWAERISPDGLGSSGWFLTAAGHVTNLIVG